VDQVDIALAFQPSCGRIDRTGSIFAKLDIVFNDQAKFLAAVEEYLQTVQMAEEATNLGIGQVSPSAPPSPRCGVELDTFSIEFKSVYCRYPAIFNAEFFQLLRATRKTVRGTIKIYQ